MLDCKDMYVSVILPIKFRGDATYTVPAHLVSSIKSGCMVKVDFAGKLYTAVVSRMYCKCLENTAKNIVYKDIIDVVDAMQVSDAALKFWEQVALYYMCTVGEVYKAAYPMLLLRQNNVKSRNTASAFFESLQENIKLPELSDSQNKAYIKIMQLFGWTNGNWLAENYLEKPDRILYSHSVALQDYNLQADNQQIVASQNVTPQNVAPQNNNAHNCDMQENGMQSGGAQDNSARYCNSCLESVKCDNPQCGDSNNHGIQNVGTQSVSEQNCGIQNVSTQVVREQDCGVQNVNAQNVSEQDSDTQRVAMQDVGKKDYGVKPIIAQKVSAQNFGIKNVSMQVVREQDCGAQNVNAQNVREQATGEQNFKVNNSNISDASGMPKFRSIAEQQGLPKMSGLPVLLHGVTGSGKTEIYINLASRVLSMGRSVLFMVPEIAISKQLQQRLKKVFGVRLLVYHSKQTAAEKARIYKIVSRQFLKEYIGDSSSAEEKTPNDAVIVLGTRSALFLPYENLGLVIADEEHDSSYKQTEPAPRYHARDAAIMLVKIHEANILLGSATPSLESEYNCRIGRFAKVSLLEKYYGALSPVMEIADTIWARKSGQMKGSFTQKLINEIAKTLDKGRQVLILRNRRSYSPVVECTECGSIPKCPNCNVNLSYHKYNGTLRCHYCDYTVKFNGICSKCGLDTLEYKGAGTERVEEELAELFPNSRIARFDADVAESKRREEAVIKAFSNREIDILVGTQMLSKGFDFEYLDLVAVLQADAILGIQDFRADERALQMFSQLMGRTGRRGTRGKIIIQTNQKNHPVLQQLKRESAMPSVKYKSDSCISESDSSFILSLMQERKEFAFAPYVRMVKILIKHKDREKLDSLCCRVGEALQKIACKEVTGPFVPVVDRVRGEWIKCYYIKFLRNKELVENKHKLLEAIEGLKANNAIIIDVDPL